MNRAHIGIIITLFYVTSTAPQEPESSSQLEISDPITTPPANENVTDSPKITDNNNDARKQSNYEVARINVHAEESISDWIYNMITRPLQKFIKAPKVNAVLRNVGTCMVNGAMEIFAFYLPTMFMPLIATLAGLVIPFEPVVMLKEKMPVNSYRRAFKTAMSSFLNTFDQYKVEEDDYDPYMTRKFNRRFMDIDKKSKY